MSESAQINQTDNIKDLLQQGKNVREVGKAVDMNMKDLKQFILDQGLEESIINKTYWVWSQEEDEQLNVEINDNLSLEQIAEAHHRTNGGIVSRMRTLKISFPETSPSYKLPKGPRKWTDGEIDQLRTLVQDGQTVELISEALKRTPNAVMAKYRKIKGKEGMEELPELKAPIKQIKRKTKKRGCAGCNKIIKVAFQCGHGSCKDCSNKWEKCKDCNETINFRLNLLF